jgi:ubiquinone/menaquinone biosynthesis C-methylase UbiE
VSDSITGKDEAMKFSTDDILKLYKSEAEKHGEGGTSTIQDLRTRHLEIQAIFSYIHDGHRVLEVGCGNGYVAEALVKAFDVEVDAFDYSQDMIAIAKRRKIEGARGRVHFDHGDVLRLEAVERYDIAFSERCLQNLVSWEDQKKGLDNIARALKRGGEYLMLESFWTGLNNLNAARRELDLEAIPESWHNRFFVEDETKAYMESIGCRYVDENCFLSGYYFGSRVLLPALMPGGKPVTSKSVLNDYFCALPPAGDFAPMKILRFRKI